MKYTKSCLLALPLLLTVFTLSAQREETLFGSRNWGFSGIWGGYTHQYTEYANTDAWNRGGFFGFEFGKSLSLGWSNYSLRNDVVLNGTDNQRFDFKYNGGKLGYAFVPYRAIHPVLNFEVGRGEVKLGGVGRDQVLIIQPSAGVEINVFRWFRFGLEGGYRSVQNYNLGGGLTEEKLSGAYGQASLKFGFSWGRYHKRSNSDRDKKRYDD